jgi:hypothetical protein
MDARYLPDRGKGSSSDIHALFHAFFFLNFVFLYIGASSAPFTAQVCFETIQTSYHRPLHHHLLPSLSSVSPLPTTPFDTLARNLAHASGQTL